VLWWPVTSASRGPLTLLRASVVNLLLVAALPRRVSAFKIPFAVVCRLRWPAINQRLAGMPGGTLVATRFFL